MLSRRHEARVGLCSGPRRHVAECIRKLSLAARCRLLEHCCHHTVRAPRSCGPPASRGAALGVALPSRSAGRAAQGWRCKFCVCAWAARCSLAARTVVAATAHPRVPPRPASRPSAHPTCAVAAHVVTSRRHPLRPFVSQAIVFFCSIACVFLLEWSCFLVPLHSRGCSRHAVPRRPAADADSESQALSRGGARRVAFGRLSLRLSTVPSTARSPHSR